jgi:Raf kinase inhibitor-like YbhB/YbcL family protein
MALLGRLLRGVRASARRSPLSRSEFDAPASIVVTSAEFADGGPMPRSAAGKGVGDDTSPALRWTGVPAGTRHVVLVIDDVDVPLPRPLLHTVAVIAPDADGVAAGGLRPGAPGMRFVRADFGHYGYAGPRPIPGHGPHHYRFHVLAVDAPIGETVTTAKALLAEMRGHVLARGVLTGTYQR